jgi:hypothetical protein
MQHAGEANFDDRTAKSTVHSSAEFFAERLRLKNPSGPQESASVEAGKML